MCLEHGNEGTGDDEYDSKIVGGTPGQNKNRKQTVRVFKRVGSASRAKTLKFKFRLVLVLV